MNSKEIIKTIGTYATTFYTTGIDAVLPKICVLCEKEGPYLCTSCLTRTPRAQTAGICPLCSKNLLKKEFGEYGRMCLFCRKELHCDGVLIPFRYKEPLIEKSIRALKYRGVREIADILANEIYTYYLSLSYIMRPKRISDSTAVALVPMPLHRSKELSRGFNQSTLIAAALSRKTGWNLEDDLVKRVRRTESQTELEKSERYYNMQGAFTVIRKPKADTTYIVVDDVITSGISVGGLSRELKTHGAQSVWAFAVAHG